MIWKGSKFSSIQTKLKVHLSNGSISDALHRRKYDDESIYLTILLAEKYISFAPEELFIAIGYQLNDQLSCISFQSFHLQQYHRLRWQHGFYLAFGDFYIGKFPVRHFVGFVESVVVGDVG